MLAQDPGLHYEYQERNDNCTFLSLFVDLAFIVLWLQQLFFMLYLLNMRVEWGRVEWWCLSLRGTKQSAVAILSFALCYQHLSLSLP